jgi:hypothetical protein
MQSNLLTVFEEEPKTSFFLHLYPEFTPFFDFLLFPSLGYIAVIGLLCFFSGLNLVDIEVVIIVA